MSNITPFYKQAGETPLLAVSRFRSKHGIPSTEKVAYAGRLDPLAEGVLLLIKGDDLKKFNNHLYCDKEYEATILFGFKTDTYDVMGLPTRGRVVNSIDIASLLVNREGIMKMPLPPFSSYKIKGKPLFWWARENRLEEIDIPVKNYTLKSLSFDSSELITSKELLMNIKNKIKEVRGDFRQNDIIPRWENLLFKESEHYLTVKIVIKVSSGFYVRSFANLLGEEIGTGGILLHLKRTKVGEYTENDCEK